MKNLIDTHFHLDHFRNHRQIYQQINDLKQYTLCVTNQPEIFESCIDLYAQNKFVKFALGFNPQYINEVRFNRSSFLRNINKTKYIGEVGLDFSSKYISKKKEQIEIFNFICEQSSIKDKIMTVHCKNAEEDIYNILKINCVKRIILHWYTGGSEWINKFIGLGCYFSINSNMLASDKFLKYIQDIPKERLLIESDGPYTKVNGKRYTVERLSDIYTSLGDITHTKDIDTVVYNNFKRLVIEM